MPTHNQFMLDSNGKISARALANTGAFFPIEVHVPPQIADALVASGQTIPSCITGMGLIDTGATYTCIHEDALKTLGLNPFDIVNSGTADGPKQQNVYAARIVFPTKGWTLDLGKCVGVNLSGQVVPINPPQPIIALLGRNLLERGILIYNGSGGMWTITLELSKP